MSLKERIEGEIKQAMLAKNKERLTPLRAIKSLILLAETEKGSSQTLTEDAEIKLLTKAAKQRKDSLAIFSEQGREDLAEKEAQELRVIEEFLPTQMSDEDLEAALKTIISEVGAAGPQDMGKVMGVATKKFAGVAEGKTISMLVKKMLN